ncbi:MAG: flagellar biosynthetic protein FliO, partial [Clostridia bacterium]|nr:flagellar biosynthetic protein FliO [Clostridia bacterium]
MWPSLIFTVLAIIFIFFLAWFATRIVGSRGNMGGQGRHIKIIEKTAVSKDCCIMLVEICGRLTAVGVTPQGMSVLHELDADEAGSVREQEPAARQGFSAAFKDALDSTLPEGRVRDTVDKLFHR